MSDKMTYTVVVDGDQYDHEVFLEMIEEFDGATVTNQGNND